MPNIGGGIAQGFAIGQAAGGRFSALGDALSQFVQQAFQEGSAQRQQAFARGERVAGQGFQREMMGEEQTFRKGLAGSAEVFTAEQARLDREAAQTRALIGQDFIPEGGVAGFRESPERGARREKMDIDLEMSKVKKESAVLENKILEAKLMSGGREAPKLSDIRLYENQLATQRERVGTIRAEVQGLMREREAKGLPFESKERLAFSKEINDRIAEFHKLESDNDKMEKEIENLKKLRRDFFPTEGVEEPGPTPSAGVGGAGTTRPLGAGVGGAGVAPGTTIQPSPFLEAAEAEMGLR